MSKIWITNLYVGKEKGIYIIAIMSTYYQQTYVLNPIYQRIIKRNLFQVPNLKLNLIKSKTIMSQLYFITTSPL